MAKIKRLTIPNDDEDVEQLNSHSCWWKYKMIQLLGEMFGKS